MMQSEHAGQRNLQQSGAAGQRNTQHATNIKKRSMRRKKARRMRRIKRIFVAAIILLVVFAAGRTSFVQGFLNHWNVKSEATLTAEGYPDSLIQLYEKNEEARQFVLDYKKNGNNEQPIDISSDVVDGKIPLFLQWDERWGYRTYGDNFLAITGCGPTALSMVYVGLTGDTSMNPYTHCPDGTGGWLLCEWKRFRLEYDDGTCHKAWLIRTGAESQRRQYPAGIIPGTSDYLYYGTGRFYHIRTFYCINRSRFRWKNNSE